MQGTWVQSLGREDPLEEGMETHLYELATKQQQKQQHPITQIPGEN